MNSAPLEEMLYKNLILALLAQLMTRVRVQMDIQG